MPETVGANASWNYDYVPAYGLNKEIIGEYLKEIWGSYKYFVEVRYWRLHHDIYRNARRPTEAQTSDIP